MMSMRVNLKLPTPTSSVPALKKPSAKILKDSAELTKFTSRRERKYANAKASRASFKEKFYSSKENDAVSTRMKAMQKKGKKAAAAAAAAAVTPVPKK